MLDEDAVKALKELRLTADDFEVKGIIGRGHFGEVVMNSHLCHNYPCPYSLMCSLIPIICTEKDYGSHIFSNYWPQS